MKCFRCRQTVSRACVLARLSHARYEALRFDRHRCATRYSRTWWVASAGECLKYRAQLSTVYSTSASPSVPARWHLDLYVTGSPPITIVIPETDLRWCCCPSQHPERLSDLLCFPYGRLQFQNLKLSVNRHALELSFSSAVVPVSTKTLIVLLVCTPHPMGACHDV